MKVEVNIKDTTSLTALDYFFILLVKIFDNMNDEELYKWTQDDIPVQYVRRIEEEIRRKLL